MVGRLGFELGQVQSAVAFHGVGRRARLVSANVKGVNSKRVDKHTYMTRW